MGEGRCLWLVAPLRIADDETVMLRVTSQKSRPIAGTGIAQASSSSGDALQPAQV